jgi:ParB/RepB/Spo0J family partition protein
MQTTDEIPIEKIEYWDNSRIRIEKTSLEPLMHDIKQKGLIQYIKVWKDPAKDRYILIVGNRRLESCKLLGWKTIPAIVVEKEDLDFQKFMTENLSENIYREDLTPLEIARVCGLLQEQGRTPGEIAEMTGISKKRIIECLRMIKKVPEKYKKHVKYTRFGNESKKGFIPVKVASAITSKNSTTPEQTERLFDEAKKNELSVRDVFVLKALIGKGYSMEEAKEKKDDIKIVSADIMLDKNELRKYNKDNKRISYSDLFSRFISGKLKPNKKLVITIVDKTED